MSVKLINGNTFSAVRECIASEVRQNISLDIKNYILVPDTIATTAKREFIKVLGKESIFNVKVLGFSQLENELFHNNNTIISKEQGLLIFKDVILSNVNNLISFNSIATNDGAVRELFSLINILADSNIAPDKLLVAGDKLGEILGAKVKDIAFLYKQYYAILKGKYIDRHISADNFAKTLINYKLPQNINLYVVDFTTMTAEELRILEGLALSANQLVIGNVCNDNSSNKRIYPRFLTDFCNQIKKNNISVDILTCNKIYASDRELLLSNLYGYNEKSNYSGSSTLSVRYAENTLLEVKGLCREIRKLVVEGGERYKDICILCPDIDNYKRDIARQFGIFEIPYFMQTKSDLGSFCIAQLLLDGIKVINSGFSASQVLTFSKNILLDICAEDISKFELFVMKYNIDAQQFLTNFEIDDPLCEIANIVRCKLIDYLSILQIDEKDNVSKLQAIQEFYKKILNGDRHNGYLAKVMLSQGIKARQEAELAYNKVFEILDMLKDFTGHNQIDLYDNIANIMANTKIVISKLNIDNVYITSDKKEIGDSKYLFIIGANDGVLVPETNSISLFTYSDLDRLNKCGISFTPDIMRLNYNEKFEAVQLIAKGQNVIISYNQELGEPSLLVKGICNLLSIKAKLFIADNNQINTDFAKYATKIGTKSNAKQELSHYYSERMRGINVGEEKVFDYLYTKLDGEYKYQNIIKQKDFKYISPNTMAWSESKDKSFASVSAIERYFGCPFKFYCERILKLKNVQHGGMDIMVVGIFIHRVLEKFFNRNKNFDFTNEQLQSIVFKLCEDTIHESEFEVLSISFSKNVLENSIYRKVEYILNKLVEIAKRSEYDVSTEVTFGFDYSKLPPYELVANGKNYHIRGKIDRVDKYGDYLAIIDYKSASSVKYTLKEVYYGERVQLLIYLNAYMANFGLKPFALLYMPLPYSYSKEGENATFRYSGFVRNLEDAISHFDSEYEDKKSSSLPSTCYNIKGNLDDKKLLAESDLQVLREYADKVVAQAISEIESGYIEPKPDSCDKCEYGQICLNKNNPMNKRVKVSSSNFEITKEDDKNGKDNI